jgi:hypothetical protein
MEISQVSRKFCLLFALTLPFGPFACSQTQHPAAQQKSAPAGAPVIGGEHFVKRTITDTQQGGMPAATIYLPESWHLDGKIEWHYGWTENPVAMSAQAENPANAEAYFCYPLLRFDSIQVAPNLRQYVKSPPKQGERMAMGAINLDPRPPLQIMAMFIHQVRGTVTNFKWVGQQSLPGLASALELDPWPGQQGIAVKIGYDLNGKPVEEAFYGVYYRTQPVNAGGAAGAVTQTNWGLRALQSFRAPAGTLDKRMTVFSVISKSVRPTPQWSARVKVIDDQLVAMFNQKLKQGYDQIRAAQEITAQVTANAAAFDKSINAQMVANRASDGGSSDGSGGGRSVNDKFDDLVRGVDTTNDPLTGTSQHSYMEQYHWTDGFGNYRNTNDPNYDPSKDNAGTWQLMTQAQ